MKDKIAIVKELINITDENNLAELNVEFKGLKVSLRRGGIYSAPPIIPQGMFPMPQKETDPIQEPPKKGEKTAEPSERVPSNAIPVICPLTGVFYSAPKPGSPPFVKVGDLVSPGQTLCIIEAMKLMNEIASETKGRVIKILKENAQIANEGETIFYLEPA